MHDRSAGGRLGAIKSEGRKGTARLRRARNEKGRNRSFDLLGSNGAGAALEPRERVKIFSSRTIAARHSPGAPGPAAVRWGYPEEWARAIWFVRRAARASPPLVSCHRLAADLEWDGCGCTVPTRRRAGCRQPADRAVPTLRRTSAAKEPDAMRAPIDLTTSRCGAATDRPEAA